LWRGDVWLSEQRYDTRDACTALLRRASVSEQFLVCRGVVRSKYVGWTDTESAEREAITGVCMEAEPTGPTPPPEKLVGFVSISGATSSKSGVDMSTPVHPVATPLVSCAVKVVRTS